MPVDMYCSRPHYAAHVRPVFDALPAEHQGTAYSLRAGEWWSSAPLPARSRLWPLQPVLVGSWIDAQRIKGRPVIMVEHGAGQAYQGDPRSATLGSYSGGDGLDSVVLFICPNQDVAARWLYRYPNSRAVAVGDPFLDFWLPAPAVLRDARTTVALTWHWDASFVPEMRWAFPHYQDALPALVKWADEHDILLLGHGHPRAWNALARRYADLGILAERSWTDVLMGADVLVADNTSAMWEWCALDRPLVVLDAPWYRHDVNHGLRFWKHADAGVRIDDPADLALGITEAMRDTIGQRSLRQTAADAIYAHRDGKSAQRAADAVLRVVGLAL